MFAFLSYMITIKNCSIKNLSGKIPLSLFCERKYWSRVTRCFVVVLLFPFEIYHYYLKFFTVGRIIFSLHNILLLFLEDFG